MKLRSLLLVIALIPILSTALIAQQTQDTTAVSFMTTDGVKIRGHLYGTGTIIVVLAHMYPADQTSWQPFAQQLASKGYAALTFDFRGYGETGGEVDIPKIELDMEGAYVYARTKSPKIVLVGASMGGTAALKVAARRNVAGVITISAPVEFKGLDAGQDVGLVTCPKLFIASSGDSPATEAAKYFSKNALDPMDQEELGGSDHGTSIFGTAQGSRMTEAIFKFLGKLLPKGNSK